MRRVIIVRAPKFEAAFETNGRVIRSDRILKFILGWSDEKARAVFRKNGWRASVLSPERAEELRHSLTEALPEDQPVPQSVADELSVRQQRDAGPFTHLCACGQWGSYGFGVSLRHGKTGEWYCAEHIPDKYRKAA